MKTGSKTRLKPENRALFAAAREGFGPTNADRARVAKALGLSVGVGTGIASATAKAVGASVATSPAALGVSSGVVAAKWAAIVVLVVGATAGGTALYSAKTGGVPAAPAAVPTEGDSSRKTSAPRAPATAKAPVAGEEVPPAAAPAALPLPQSPAPAPASPKPVDVARGRSVASSTPAAARAAAPPPAPSEAPSAPLPAAPSASSTQPAPADTSGVRVAEEAHLLREADAALRAGDTAGAARLLDDHARLFPHGVLAEERDFQRVLILCTAGQVGAARAAAGGFLSAYPQSVFAGRVRASCGGR